MKNKTAVLKIPLRPQPLTKNKKDLSLFYLSGDLSLLKIKNKTPVFKLMLRPQPLTKNKKDLSFLLKRRPQSLKSEK